ncbi:MAG: hypothetical protein RIQ81_348 [Pseudomonadota bacterium]|jgi:hypothetical protein
MGSVNPGIKFQALFVALIVALCSLDPAVVAFAESPSPEAATLPVKLQIRFRKKGSGDNVTRTEVTAGEQKFRAAPDGSVVFELPADAVFRCSRFGFKPLEVSVADLLQQAKARLDAQIQENAPAPQGQVELKLDIFLEPALGGDDTVVVTGKKRPGVSKQVISVEEARRVAPGGDPGQVTKLMPGVQKAAFGSQVVIRGSAPDDSKYYIDDLEVPFVYHGVGQYTVLPASMIEDVEFSAGGFGAEYGDATGGVIKIRSKTKLVERPTSIFTVNMPIYSSAFHERPVGEKASFSLSVRRSYLDYILPKVLPEELGATIVPYFSDYVALYNEEFDDGRGRLISIASTDGLRAVFPNDAARGEDGNAAFSVFNYYGILGYERTKRINGDWSLSTTPQLQYFRLKFQILDNSVRLKVWSAKVPAELTWKLNADDKIYFGIDPRVDIATVYFRAIRFDPNDPFFDPDEAPVDEGSEESTTKGGAGWVSMEKRLGPVLLIPGVRAYYNDQLRKSSADPRLSMRWDINDVHTAKFATGLFSKNPEPGEASKSFGNPDLDFERSLHYVAGVESRWTDRWSSDVQLFSKKAWNLVRVDPEKRFVNGAELRSRGAEILIRRNLTERLFGWLSYTWSRNEARESGETGWHNAEYDQTHVANLAGNYRLTELWELGGRFNYHTGDTFTPKGNAVYNANLDKYQPRQGDTELYEARLPNYNEISLYAGRDILWDTWKMNLRFGIEYLWFKRAALGVNYNYDYTKEMYFQGVPPIPYLELQAIL